MSIIERLKTSFFGQFWLVYEQKIILAIGMILIAAISFEAGYLHGQKNKSESVVVKKVAASEAASACAGQSQTDASSTKTASADSQSASTENTAETSTQKCAYVASKNSNKYHLPTCRYAQNIKPENKICFSSKEEAESKGFQGAKCCIK
jgi:Flp pilus assembly protein TadG